jgi:DNA-binding NarL/FixJ family response regulator
VQGEEVIGRRPASEAGDPAKVRVVLVDDHCGVRRGLALLLGTDPEIVVVGEADGQTAVEVVGEQQPDVVLMDLHMPVLDGVGATRALHAAGFEGRVLVLTGRAEPERVQAALAAGAVGFFHKDSNPADLLAGVRRAAARSA